MVLLPKTVEEIVENHVKCHRALARNLRMIDLLERSRVGPVHRQKRARVPRTKELKETRISLLFSDTLDGKGANNSCQDILEGMILCLCRY